MKPRRKSSSDFARANDVPCPTCFAEVGENCRRSGRQGHREPHDARIAAHLKKLLYRLDPIVHSAQGYLPSRCREMVDSWGWERMIEELPEVRRLLDNAGTPTQENEES